MPVLPWKQGERDAFKTISPEISERIIPIFEMPPAGDYDHELERILSPAEHLRNFGPRLFRSRGRLPVFIDASQIDDARHSIDGGTHPLTALIERARLAGAQAWPVATLEMSDAHRLAAKEARHRHDSPLAIRLRLSELEAPKLSERLRDLCHALVCDPSGAVLVVDGRSRHIPDASEFALSLANRLNELPSLHEWVLVAIAVTTLTDPIKILPGSTKTITRMEWLAYEHLVRTTDLIRVPVFSDYGVEFKERLRPIKARPTAKLNYSTPDAYRYSKGKSVKAAGYEAIYPVAQDVARSSAFMGPQFSEGDRQIALWAAEILPPGGAPKWRWAAVDHHLTLATRQLAAALRVVVETASAPAAAPQDDLFGRQ